MIKDLDSWRPFLYSNTQVVMGTLEILCGNAQIQYGLPEKLVQASTFNPHQPRMFFAFRIVLFNIVIKDHMAAGPSSRLLATKDSVNG